MNKQQEISRLAQKISQQPKETSEEPVFLMESKEGLLVQVPMSKLPQWQAELDNPRELTEDEQHLKDTIVSRLYGTPSGT